ncbi:MAG: CoA-binding protein [Clostridia bacterium]|nr:CoA-binding protein [Clostridia bacterium]
MSGFTKDFFTDNEVLFVGYSQKNQVFSKSIYEAMSNGGLKVFALNTKDGGSYDVKVYKSYEELPHVPKAALVLLSLENARKAVKQLADHGVKKILFQNKKMVDQDIMDQCAKAGIEAVVACPLMRYGKGIHKLHAFFAGVR